MPITSWDRFKEDEAKILESFKAEDKEEETEDIEDSSEPQPEEKPKKRSYAPRKKEEPPIALKSCVIRLDGADVTLVKGQPIEGLSSQELKHLKKHKFVR